LLRVGVLPALGEREQPVGGGSEFLTAADRHAEQERGDRGSWPVHLVRDFPGEIENRALIHDRRLHAELGAGSADPRLQRAHRLPYPSVSGLSCVARASASATSSLVSRSSHPGGWPVTTLVVIPVGRSGPSRPPSELP